MTQAQSAEEKARLKKLWTEQAIQQALTSQWEEAVTTNKSILNIFPTEPEAYNRLGKAHSELGQYTEARLAYQQTLKYSPNNAIARKNLDRLALVQEEGVRVLPGGVAIDPALFTEEPGKTALTELINLAPAAILAKVGVGDRVQFHVSSHSVYVRNAAGEDIGQLEPRLANRLIGFMDSGNRYAAGVLNMDQGQVRLMVREEYQHPNMFGKVSFPAHGGGDQIRAYIKDSMLRYDRDDEDELLNEDEYYDGGDDAEEMTEIDFEGNNDSEE